MGLGLTLYPELPDAFEVTVRVEHLEIFLDSF